MKRIIALLIMLNSLILSDMCYADSNMTKLNLKAFEAVSIDI